MSEAHAHSIISTLLNLRAPAQKTTNENVAKTSASSKTYTATRRLNRKPENPNG